MWIAYGADVRWWLVFYARLLQRTGGHFADSSGSPPRTPSHRRTNWKQILSSGYISSSFFGLWSRTARFASFSSCARRHLRLFSPRSAWIMRHAEDRWMPDSLKIWRTERWACGWSSWLGASSSTADSFSLVRADFGRPLPTAYNIQIRNYGLPICQLHCPLSIFPDFSTSTHLRANSDHWNIIFCLFRVYTLLFCLPWFSCLWFLYFEFSPWQQSPFFQNFSSVLFTSQNTPLPRN